MSLAGCNCLFILSRTARLLQLNQISCCLAATLFSLQATAAVAYQETYNFTTPAGTPYVLGGNQFGAADGTNNSALFYAPAGLAIDGATNLYVADGRVIRRIRP